MYYIVQNNLFREEGHQKLIASLERFGLSYELVDVLPFVEEIEYQTQRKDVFVFGSIKMARIVEKYGWNPSTAINENFNFEVYSKYYGENLLNHDSIILKFSDDFSWPHGQRFIRPCLDTKTFTGKVFEEDEWKPFVERMLKDEFSSLTAETMIQVSTPKRIYQEIRTWVIGGEIATQSLYKRGHRVISDPNVDEEAIDFARKMIGIYQLGPAFTLDICLTDDGWKIVECGSISCAGFYASDVQKIIMSLEDYYGRN